MKAVMDTWTKQLGYPVVTTRRINATHLEVEQKRFSLDPPGAGKISPPKILEVTDGRRSSIVLIRLKAKARKDLAQVCCKRVPRAQEGRFTKNEKTLPGIHPIHK